MQLQTSTILSVPLQIYAKDFSFFVNGEEFKTSKIISDLLSPIICQIHSNDPTFSNFIINTREPGNFSHILNLVNFKTINFSENEIPFISEVINILGNNSIKYVDDKLNFEIANDNVFSQIAQHEKLDVFFSKQLSDEIDFISSNFYELCETHEEYFAKLSILTLTKILVNEKLHLKNENQLLKFVNKLYSKSSDYSNLFETVLFENVSSETMREFLSVYDINDISGETWNRISNRLEKEISEKNENSEAKYKTRYNKAEKESSQSLSGRLFEAGNSNEFNGILRFLRTQSNDQIEKEVDITSSSTYNDSYLPGNVVLFEEKNKSFESKDLQGSWLCFDFKERKIVPTDYTIRSYPCSPNYSHPKSWVIEGSNDKSSWETVDEQNDCPYLNGNYVVHTFSMNHKTSKEFRYIRMRLTGTDWQGFNYLMFNSIEFYGRLI